MQQFLTEPHQIFQNQEQPKDPGFQTFLKMAQMRRYRRFLEKKLKAQRVLDNRQKTLQKIKIMPPKYHKGLSEYNPQSNQELTSRRISFHLPQRLRQSDQTKGLPKLTIKQKPQNSHKWSQIYRRDEVNKQFPSSYRSQKFQTLEKQVSGQKIRELLKKKLHTDQSQIKYERSAGSIYF